MSDDTARVRRGSTRVRFLRSRGVTEKKVNYDAWCDYCGATGTIRWMGGDSTHSNATGSMLNYSEGVFEIDHVIPISRGGADDPSNMRLACRTCNTSKGNRTLAEWHDWLRSPRGTSTKLAGRQVAAILGVA